MPNKVKNNKQTKIKAPIVEALKTAYNHPTYQFHIPGHTKGLGTLPEFRRLVGKRALMVDTTDEFDNLGTLTPATGPIKEAEELAAEAFGAKRTFFLINGSTIGNLAIAMGLTRKGQKVIVNRNCHRSILTGLIISGAEPLWIVPEKLSDWGLWGNIEAKDVETLLENNDDVSAVWITNPTYEGVVSDIESIAKICKKFDVPLIVDEAHGCLWNFNDKLPTSSLKLGADIVVHSLHKTGGSMSQSSMLHVSENSKICVEDVERALEALAEEILEHAVDMARGDVERIRNILYGDVAVVVRVHIFADLDGKIDVGGHRLDRLRLLAEQAAQDGDEVLLIQGVYHQVATGGLADDLSVQVAEDGAAAIAVLTEKVGGVIEIAQGSLDEIVLILGAFALALIGVERGRIENEHGVLLFDLRLIQGVVIGAGRHDEEGAARQRAAVIGHHDMLCAVQTVVDLIVLMHMHGFHTGLIEHIDIVYRKVARAHAHPDERRIVKWILFLVILHSSHNPF